MNPKTLSLKQNISWTLAGNILYSLCQWAILSSLAKFGSSEMVGQFTLALAVVSPVFMLSGFQLRSLVATERDSLFDFTPYVQLRLLTGLVTLLIIFIITIIVSYDMITIKVIWLVALLKLIESFTDLTYGIFQKQQRMDFIGKSLVLRGSISLLIFALTIFLSNSLVIALMVNIAFSIIILWNFEYRKTKIVISIKIDQEQLLKIVKMGGYLGVVLFIISINANVQKYILSYYLDIKEVGYFSAIAYLTIAGNVLINGIAQAVSPRLALLSSNEEKKEIKSLMMKINGIAVGVGLLSVLISILFGKYVLSLLYDPSYGYYSTLLILVLIAATFQFMSTFLGYALTAARIIKQQPILQIYVLVVSIVTSYIFISQYGINGAGYSMIVAAFVQWIGSLYLFNRFLKA